MLGRSSGVCTPVSLALAVGAKLVVPPAEIIRVVDALAVIGVVAVIAKAGSKIAAPVSAARTRDLKRPWFMGIFSPLRNETDRRIPSSRPSQVNHRKAVSQQPI